MSELQLKRVVSGQEFELKRKPTAGGYFSAAISPTEIPLYAFAVMMAVLIAYIR